MAVAKASVCPHSEAGTCDFPPVNVVFFFRSENIRDRFPATVTSGPTTGIEKGKKSYVTFKTGTF